MIYQEYIRNNKEKQETSQDIQRILAQEEIQSRILFISGGIDKNNAHKITRSLLLLDQISDLPIKVFINSPGGEINSGFAIYDCIRFVRAKVYLIGWGLVASAAALIYLAVPKEQRLSFPNARYLLHQPLSGIQGVVTDLEIHAREVENLKQQINIIIAKGTKRNIVQVEKDTDRDFWLTASEGVKYGLVGRIAENKKDLGGVFARVYDKKEKGIKKNSTESNDQKKKEKKISSEASSKVSGKTNKLPKKIEKTQSKKPKKK